MAEVAEGMVVAFLGGFVIVGFRCVGFTHMFFSVDKNRSASLLHFARQYGKTGISVVPLSH